MRDRNAAFASARGLTGGLVTLHLRQPCRVFVLEVCASQWIAFFFAVSSHATTSVTEVACTSKSHLFRCCGTFVA